MVNTALATLGKKKVSAKGKFTAQTLVRGRVTEQDKRSAAATQAQKETTLRRPDSDISSGNSEVQSAQAPDQLDREAQQRRVEEVHRESVERQKLDKPGGWRNVVDVLKIALNPFSKSRISASTGSEGVDAALGAIANNPFTAAGLVTGVGGLVRGAASGIAAVTARTAVAQAGKIGTTGFYKVSVKQLGKKGVAQTMATNTATKKATASFLTKAVGAVKDPQFVIGGLMATIGSYPFAGFIKEEALQTVGFGVGVAMNNGDIAGAEEAIALQEQILDPGTWDEIKSKIPFVNVLASLDDFYGAARLKLDIDKKVISDLKIKTERGETDTEMYARIAEDRKTLKEQERVSDAEYYKGIADRKAEAKAADRAADAAYYKGLSAAAAKPTH